MRISIKHCIQCGLPESKRSLLHRMSTRTRVFEAGSDAPRIVHQDEVFSICSDCSPNYYDSAEFNEELFFIALRNSKGCEHDPEPYSLPPRTVCDTCESPIYEDQLFHTLEPSVTMYRYLNTSKFFGKPDHLFRPFFLMQTCDECNSRSSLRQALLACTENTLARHLYHSLGEAVH